MAVPQKYKMELPYDLTVPFLGIFQKELKQGLKETFVQPCLLAALYTSQKV